MIKPAIRSFIATFSALFLLCTAHAQLFPVTDLGHCDPTLPDTAGFRKLKSQFAGKRIVVIGEQQHGVENGYVNFAHFIRFLHEEMGFNVIAQEYCFFGFGLTNMHYQQGASAQEYRKSMYWPQGASDKMNAVLDYLDSRQGKPDKIYMEGFDSRVSLQRLFYNHIDSLVRKSGIPFASSQAAAGYYTRLKKLCKNEYRDTISDPEAHRFLANTDTIIRQLQQQKQTLPRDLQLLQNLKGFARNAWDINHIADNSLQRYHEREKQMFNNLVWLLEVAYPTEKFIVLTHNAHGAKNVKELEGLVPDSVGKNAMTVGSLLHERYGRQCMHIATTSYSGTYCYHDFDPITVPVPLPQSLEAILYNKGYDYAYVDLQSSHDSAFPMFHFNYNDWVDPPQVTAKFGRLYDGVIFIRESQAAKPASPADNPRNYPGTGNMPAWAVKQFAALKLDTAYRICAYINPYYLEGDFNGDKKMDIAVSIIQRQTKKQGILILHGNSNAFFVLGAGTPFSKGGANFRWLDTWKIYRESKLVPGFGETAVVKLKSDALFVGNSLLANAVIYWNGSAYTWYQQDGF